MSDNGELESRKPYSIYVNCVIIKRGKDSEIGRYLRGGHQSFHRM